MIYLVGGPPRCGKTTVARSLAARLGCSWLPVDYLQSIVYHYLPDEQRATMSPLLEGSTDEKYAAHSSAEIIANYRLRARTLWPAIQVFMHFALAADHDYVLEGFHIEPELLSELIAPGEGPIDDAASLTHYQQAMVRSGTAYALRHAGDERIRAVFLYREDATTLDGDLLRGTGPRDWLRRDPPRPETLERIASMVVAYGEYVRDEVARLGGRAVKMDDFESGMERAIAVLAGTGI